MSPPSRSGFSLTIRPLRVTFPSPCDRLRTIGLGATLTSSRALASPARARTRSGPSSCHQSHAQPASACNRRSICLGRTSPRKPLANQRRRSGSASRRTRPVRAPHAGDDRPARRDPAPTATAGRSSPISPTRNSAKFPRSCGNEIRRLLTRVIEHRPRAGNDHRQPARHRLDDRQTQTPRPETAEPDSHTLRTARHFPFIEVPIDILDRIPSLTQSSQSCSRPSARDRSSCPPCP